MKRKITRKRRPSAVFKRDYDSPVYNYFRTKVKDRDGNRCRWPGCQENKKLQVHHIKTWKRYPWLRFEVSNGITLCEFHHMMINGYESYYITFFYSILNNKAKK
jgi:predicted restriction endonuclease